MFRDEVCGSVIIRSWGMEYPIFSFSYFFSWRPFWKCSRRGSASQIFHVNITDSYSIGYKLAEKYKFVNLREGPLWPTAYLYNSVSTGTHFWCSIIKLRLPKTNSFNCDISLYNEIRCQQLQFEASFLPLGHFWNEAVGKWQKMAANYNRMHCLC